MGDDNKRSFWTSLPGILTGVAAVIAAVGGIIAAHYYQPSPIPAPSPASSPSSSPSPASSPSSSPSPAYSSSPPINSTSVGATNSGDSPAFVKVILHVNNAGGGAATAIDFEVITYGDTAAKPGLFDGSETGTIVAMNPGRYSLSVISHTGNTPVAVP